MVLLHMKLLIQHLVQLVLSFFNSFLLIIMLMAFLDLEINLVIKGTCIFGNNGYPSSGSNYGYHSGNNFGGNGYRGKGNGGYKSKLNGNRYGSWSGNTTNRPNVIPECHMCL